MQSIKENIFTSSPNVRRNIENIENIENTESIETSIDINEESEYNITKWDDLDIPSQLLRGIYAMGFESPSPIQCKAIKPILTNKDVIAQAQSGTGKTATFAIGALAKIYLENKKPQVLCLSPTRELANQTADVIKNLGSMMSNFNVMTLVGGSSIDNDMKNLRSNPNQILSGCPGRVHDVFRRNPSIVSDIRMIILDEADEILSSGFEEQIHSIFQYLHKDTQFVVCSATMPNHIKQLTTKIMNNPINIYVKTEQLTLEGISQYYIALENDVEKYETLKDLYSSLCVSQSIIYANSVKRVNDLYEALCGEGFAVCCIHSNMSKEERESSLQSFKSGSYRILISSNVTARGIDIQQVSIVINFDIPRDISTYLHRIGRSGRWGRKGMGINMVTRRDVDKLREIESYYSTQIEELPSNFDTL